MNKFLSGPHHQKGWTALKCVVIGNCNHSSVLSGELSGSDDQTSVMKEEYVKEVVVATTEKEYVEEVVATVLDSTAL